MSAYILFIYYIFFIVTVVHILVCSVNKMIYHRFVNTHFLYIINKTTNFISRIWGNGTNQVDSVTVDGEIRAMYRSSFTYMVFK